MITEVFFKGEAYKATTLISTKEGLSQQEVEYWANDMLNQNYADKVMVLSIHLVREMSLKDVPPAWPEITSSETTEDGPAI